ncbi:hypothetical protein EBR25_03465 [bacterium]|jgi:ABC-type sugar transport system permease subunit|nr:hypothetical protein [bacterium]
MDNGEVIPGLNEGWTFAGARPMEWGSGLMLAIIVQEFVFTGSPARTMPYFIGIIIGTAFLLKALRSSFPDEEKGVANYCMSQLGIEPPTIPAPSSLQPMWSGTPLQSLSERKEFVELGLMDVFLQSQEDDEDIEENEWR